MIFGFGERLGGALGFNPLLTPLRRLLGDIAHTPVLDWAMPPLITVGARAIAEGLAPRLAAALVGYGLLLSRLTLRLWVRAPRPGWAPRLNARPGSRRRSRPAI